MFARLLSDVFYCKYKMYFFFYPKLNSLLRQIAILAVCDNNQYISLGNVPHA